MVTVLTVAPPHEIHVWLAWWDVDDPTAENNAVDGETWPYDNRAAHPGFVPGGEAGAIRDLTFPAGTRSQTANFVVSMQPGDNVRIVANGDLDFLKQLVNHDTVQNVGVTAAERNANKQRIVNRFIPGTPAEREVQIELQYVSETLTVWRFLQVELDTMPSAATINPLSETMHNFVGTGTALTEIWTADFFRDASRDLDQSPPGNGRFENGSLTVGATGAITIGPITGNGRNRFVFPAASIAGLPFVAKDTANLVYAGTIADVTKNAGGHFVWTLSFTGTPPNFAALASLQVGGGAWVTIDSAAAPTVTTSLLRIPIVANDDDDLSQLPYPIDALNYDLFNRPYEAAYIKPVMAPMGHNQTSTVLRNMTFADLEGVQESQMDAHRADRYWVAYVLWTWQFDENNDRDPNNEPFPNNENGLGWTLDDRWSGVAIESTGDYYWNGAYSTSWSDWGYESDTDLVWRMAAHEVGHQFALDHSNAPGLMWIAEGPGAVTQYFHPVDLHRIRARPQSPGR